MLAIERVTPLKLITSVSLQKKESDRFPQVRITVLLTQREIERLGLNLPTRLWISVGEVTVGDRRIPVLILAPEPIHEAVQPVEKAVTSSM